MSWRALVTVPFLLLLSKPALAEPLPSAAVPLRAAELRKIYSGKTIIWSNRDAAYFAPNGKVKVVFTNDNGGDGRTRYTGYSSGSWSVTDNHICWNVSGTAFDTSTKVIDAFSNNVWCWDWYKSGSKYYTRHRNNGRVSTFNTQAIGRLHDGDRVSVWFDEYKVKFKR